MKHARLLFISLSTAVLTSTSTVSAQGIPVLDATAIAKFLEQIVIAKNQLESAQRQLQSLTGVRNLGDILNNPAIRNSLPSDVRDLLKTTEQQSSALSASVEAILGKTRAPVGDFTVDRQSLEERWERLNATAQAINEQAYAGAQARLAQIDALQAQINQTQDPKAISELQARIAIEQANIQTDQMRVQLATQQIQTERELIKDRAMQVHKGWYDPSTVPKASRTN